MQTMIELPDSIYREGERIAHARGFTLEQFIVGVLEREVLHQNSPSHSQHRVSLPLIHSRQPGTLDLSNFDFDDLLA